MSSLETSGIILACVYGGALLGMVLRTILPKQHLSSESKDVVKGSSIPMPFLVVMVAWLAILLASFSLFAQPNSTVVVALLICALAVSSAVFLILELDRPFAGLIQISSGPLRNALEMLGR